MLVFNCNVQRRLSVYILNSQIQISKSNFILAEPHQLIILNNNLIQQYYRVQSLATLVDKV